MCSGTWFWCGIFIISPYFFRYESFKYSYPSWLTNSLKPLTNLCLSAELHAIIWSSYVFPEAIDCGPHSRKSHSSSSVQAATAIDGWRLLMSLSESSQQCSVDHAQCCCTKTSRRNHIKPRMQQKHLNSSERRHLTPKSFPISLSCGFRHCYPLQGGSGRS